MASRVVLEGVEAFRAALRNLPSELAGEAQEIVVSAAEQTKAEVVATYPAVTGNLRKGVSVKTERSPFGTVAIVKSNAHHAHLYEYGTQTRSYEGANRGAMPAKLVMASVAPRRRRAMEARLKGLLVKAGFQVSGDA